MQFDLNCKYPYILLRYIWPRDIGYWNLISIHTGSLEFIGEKYSRI